jgi:putative tricarboxylic transport membrane protein
MNLKIGCFFLALSIFVIVFMVPTISRDWREASFTSADMYAIGPRFFPYLAAAIIGILSVALIAGALKSKQIEEAEEKPFMNAEHFKNILVFLVIAVLYIALFQWLGAIIATLLCLICNFTYFEVRGWVWRIGLSLATTLVIYLCFAKMMMVPLPMGFLE